MDNPVYKPGGARVDTLISEEGLERLAALFPERPGETAIHRSRRSVRWGNRPLLATVEVIEESQEVIEDV